MGYPEEDITEPREFRILGYLVVDRSKSQPQAAPQRSHICTPIVKI
jgi:hypothetical protein